MSTMNPKILKRWRWLFVWEWNLRHIGLGIEFALDYWFPREWSVYLQLGPLLVGGGRERDMEAEMDAEDAAWRPVPTPTGGEPT